MNDFDTTCLSIGKGILFLFRGVLLLIATALFFFGALMMIFGCKGMWDSLCWETFSLFCVGFTILSFGGFICDLSNTLDPNKKS